MHQIGRELHHVAETRALRGERGADIGECLGALRVEAVGRLAVLVGADADVDAPA